MDFKFKKSNLNFRVYTSETEPTEPGTENDIVIITSVPMPNWILSPDEPSGAPRSDGDVWIRYSVTGNTFNILKNDRMMIATISAKQYVEGKWVVVTARSYQGGVWVDWWNGGLYVNGNTYDSVTGGWATKSISINSNYPSHAGTPTAVYNEADVVISQTTNKAGLWHTKNKISLSGYTKLQATLSNITHNGSNTQIYLEIRDELTSYMVTAVATATVFNRDDGVSTPVTNPVIDFSELSLTGSYYIAIGIYSEGSLDVSSISLT